MILPKHLLAAALSKSATDPTRLEFLLQYNYENPLFRATALQRDMQLSRLTEMLHLSVDDFAGHAKALSSAEELSV